MDFTAKKQYRSLIGLLDNDNDSFSSINGTPGWNC